MSINNVTVNEGSPYAVVEVSLSLPATQTITFTPSLADGSGSASTDLSGIQYFNGTNWVSAASGVTIPVGDSSVLLRTAVVHDTLNENSETVNIVTGTTTNVLNPNGVTGIVTILDRNQSNGLIYRDSNPVNGAVPTITPASGNVVTPTTNAPLLDDDRPLSVNSITVNEGSPYAVFTVSANTNQYIKLHTQSETATQDVDYSSSLQYFDGTSWQNYNAETFVKVPNGETSLLVRVTIINDNPYEKAETFKLFATNTQGATTNGVGTIIDDRTGLWFDGNSAISSTTAPNRNLLDDDRIIHIEPMQQKESTQLPKEQQVEQETVAQKTTALQKTTEKAKSVAYNEIRETLVVTNTGRVVVEFAGQHERPNNEIVEVRVFEMKPDFVKVIVKDSAYREGDAKFEMFALDGSQAPNWLNIDSQTGLITGIPPIGLDEIVVQVKIIGNDGKIKSVDVEIKIPPQEQVFNGTLSQQLKLYADVHQKSTQLIHILQKPERGA